MKNVEIKKTYSQIEITKNDLSDNEEKNIESVQKFHTKIKKTYKEEINGEKGESIHSSFEENFEIRKKNNSNENNYFWGNDEEFDYSQNNSKGKFNFNFDEIQQKNNQLKNPEKLMINDGTLKNKYEFSFKNLHNKVNFENQKIENKLGFLDFQHNIEQLAQEENNLKNFEQKNIKKNIEKSEEEKENEVNQKHNTENLFFFEEDDKDLKTNGNFLKNDVNYKTNKSNNSFENIQENFTNPDLKYFLLKKYF